MKIEQISAASVQKNARDGMPTPVRRISAAGALAASAPDLDISAHEAWFARYVSLQRTGAEAIDGPLDLKFTHSLNVLAHARAVVGAEHLPSQTARAVLLAALYHDIARFPQYRRWQTFSDPFSTNHGILGSRILNALRPLEHEPRRIRLLAQGAVVMHNRFALPHGLTEEMRCVVDVVRDCDRLDILHVMADMLGPGGPKRAENVASAAILHLPEVKDAYSPAVYQAVIESRPAKYREMRTRNDFRLLLCTWCCDFRFQASRAIVRASGLVQEVLDSLPDLPEMAVVREKILTCLHGES